MRVYIASLSDYNNGRLEGKWFNLSYFADASELMDAINDMLNNLTEKYKDVDGEVREEWAVHDYEGIPPTLASEYMGEEDFQKLFDIEEVAQDRDIPVEVLVERAGDTGSDDYQALAESLVMVVDGSDELDIVHELEDQMGELGNDFWKDYIFIDDVTERVMYSEDVDRFREDILSENPDLDEDEAESQAEEMADEEAERRRDLSTYLEDMGYGDEIPDFVTKDYNDAWKYALSYDYDVIHYNGDMYVFTNNYSVGGTILSGLVGAYIGYKIGRAKPQKKGFETEKKIGRKIKGAFSKKKYAEGGKLDSNALNQYAYIYIDDKKRNSSKALDDMFALLESYNIEIDNNSDDIGNGIGQEYYDDEQLIWTYAFDFNDIPKSRREGFIKQLEDLEKKHSALSFELQSNTFAKGGGIGFKGLSDKVAKRYAGKKVAPKYQGEYGKRYSKYEAKEVGNKVAGKVYWQQKGRKMAMGGGLAQYPNDLPKSEAERLFHLAHKNAKVGDRLWNNFKRTPLRLIYSNLEERGIKYARGGNVNTGLSWHLDQAKYNKSESYEKPMSSRKRKYEDGGQIGQEIVFDDSGEENTGVIKDITNAGDYIVKSDDGRTLLAQRQLDVISLGAMRSASNEAPRKRFGLFEDGGQIGQEIVFDDSGEENTGVIKDVTNAGDYIVSSDDGRTLLAQRDRDVISLGKMREKPMAKKRFGFFEEGGGVSGLDDLIRG